MDLAVPDVNHADVQHMARAGQGVAESIIQNEYVGARAERCQKMITEKSVHIFMTCDKMMMKQTWLQ